MNKKLEENIKELTLKFLIKALPQYKIEVKGETLPEYTQTIQELDYVVDIKYFITQNEDSNLFKAILYYTATQNKNSLSLKEFLFFLGNDIKYLAPEMIDEFINLEKPLLDYYFSSEPLNNEQDIHYFETVYYNPVANPTQIQGWRVIMSKQLLEIDNSRSYSLDERHINTYLNTMFDAMHQAFFSNPNTYLLRFWILRHKIENIIHVECYVNGQEWETGTQILRNFIEKLDMTSLTKISVKQNIFLIPTKVSDLKNGNDILDKVKTQTDLMNQLLKQQMVEEKDESSNRENKTIKKEDSKTTKKKKWWQF